MSIESTTEYKQDRINVRNINAIILTGRCYKYKDNYYSLRILPIFNPKRPSINFGDTDENYENLNLNKLIKSPYSSRILAAIFGLVRFWVDKYNIQEFEYVAEGDIRNKLYDYYLDKHFSDFKNSQEKIGDETIQIWTKK